MLMKKEVKTRQPDDIFQLDCDLSLTLSQSFFLQRLKKEFLSFSGSFSPRIAGRHVCIWLQLGGEGTRLQAGRGACSCEAGERGNCVWLTKRNLCTWSHRVSAGSLPHGRICRVAEEEATRGKCSRKLPHTASCFRPSGNQAPAFPSEFPSRLRCPSFR